MKIIVEIPDNIPAEGLLIKVFPYGVHVIGSHSKRQKLITPIGLTDRENLTKLRLAVRKGLKYFRQVKNFSFFGYAGKELKAKMFEAGEEYLLGKTGIHKFNDQAMFKLVRNFLLDNSF